VSLPAIAGVHDGEERYALAYLAHLADHPGADQVVMPSAYEITPDRATVAAKRGDARRRRRRSARRQPDLNTTNTGGTV